MGSRCLDPDGVGATVHQGPGYVVAKSGANGPARSLSLPAPTRTWSRATRTSTSASDHHSRLVVTLLPQSRTTAPTATTTTRSHRTFGATQRPAPLIGSSPVFRELAADLLQTAGHGAADGRAVPVRAGEQTRHDQDDSEPEHDLLAALEVGEQGLVEDPAGRPERRTRELVDEQLLSDGEHEGEQEGVGGDDARRSIRPSGGGDGPAEARPGRGRPRRGGPTWPPDC